MNRLASILITLSLPVLLFAGLPQGAATSVKPAVAEQSSLSEPLAIVVNRSNTVNDVTLAELRKVFLGERGHWPNGRRITLVMREPSDPERKAILREVCQMSESQLKSHILHGLFTGEILVSPKILDTPAGVRKFIFNVPGAIGYLRLTDVDATVKVVRVEELLPGDDGYKLRSEAPPAN